MEYVVISSLSISLFLLDDLLTLLWVFSMPWDSCSRSGQCVKSGYQVGDGFVGFGYQVGGGGSWLFSVYSSTCSAVSLSPYLPERIILGVVDALSC